MNYTHQAFSRTAEKNRYLIDIIINFINLIFVSAVILSSIPAHAEKNEKLTEVSLEELLSNEVTTASKLAQQISDSPSAVSIVTAKDIKSYGYRTLAEIIGSMRGLNTVSDHLYTYMSGRGFGQPGDYPGRVMLLIDGQQANDSLYNAAYLGHDGLIDVELIDRVEYVSGPGAVIYGNGAFYGIINVFTKKGADINATQLAVDTASHDSYKGRLSYGKKLDNGADILISASGYRSQGRDYYFSAFDDPSTNFGRVNNLDQERNRRLFFKGQYQNWSLEAALVDRKKDDPGASFGADFNTKPSYTADKNAYINLKYEDTISQDLKTAIRGYYGHYGYDAKSVFSGSLYQESNIANWWGTEARFVYTGFDNHQLLYGFEYRNDYRQDFYLPTVNAEHSIYMASAYVQDEYRWNKQWKINTGLRADYGGKQAKNLAPRVALIYSPHESLDVKASYSTAFRRPNAYEKYYGDGTSILVNPDIKKEQVEATELVLEYRPDEASKLLGSAYFYKTDNHIEFTDVALLPGIQQATNQDRYQTQGMDVEYERKFSAYSRLRASYAWQYATGSTGNWLINSPKHLAKINYAQGLFDGNLNLGLEMQYVGKRKAEQNETLGGYTLANLTLYNDTWIKNSTISMSIKNLFDKDYSVPSPDFYRPLSFEQDGRNYWMQFTYNIK